jgi:hypothetical protein
MESQAFNSKKGEKKQNLTLPSQLHLCALNVGESVCVRVRVRVRVRVKVRVRVRVRVRVSVGECGG